MNNIISHLSLFFIIISLAFGYIFSNLIKKYTKEPFRVRIVLSKVRPKSNDWKIGIFMAKYSFKFKKKSLWNIFLEKEAKHIS